MGSERLQASVGPRSVVERGLWRSSDGVWVA